MGMVIGILGASGFVGARAVEWFGLSAGTTVRPVVRAYSSLARVSRFPLEFRLADGCDEAAMAEAFQGCDVVLNSIVGTPETIVQSAIASYRAAAIAGVKRMVYLSSASVHGQNPAVGTTESSPLSDRQDLDYNNAKVKAERALLELRQTGSVEVVILRPSIVFGPRSRWALELAGQFLDGQAYLVNGGSGICNSIYVDNLLHAIELAATAPGIDGEVFLVGDRERVTWLEFYLPFARAFGTDERAIATVDPVVIQKGWRDRLDSLRGSGVSQALLPLFPSKLKQAVKGAIAAWSAPPRTPAWRSPAPVRPRVSVEMSLLHQCQYQLPYTKAEAKLGYKPVVSFSEGIQRTIAWLEFAGYPISHSPASHSDSPPQTPPRKEA